jgi:hypothetical protein
LIFDSGKSCILVGLSCEIPQNHTTIAKFMASSKKILSANWFESLEILFSANFLLGIRKPVQPGQSSPGCGSLAISGSSAETVGKIV